MNSDFLPSYWPAFPPPAAEPSAWDITLSGVEASNTGTTPESGSPVGTREAWAEAAMKGNAERTYYLCLDHASGHHSFHHSSCPLCILGES